MRNIHLIALLIACLSLATTGVAQHEFSLHFTGTQTFHPYQSGSDRIARVTHPWMYAHNVGGTYRYHLANRPFFLFAGINSIGYTYVISWKTEGSPACPGCSRSQGSSFGANDMAIQLGIGQGGRRLAKSPWSWTGGLTIRHLYDFGSGDTFTSRRWCNGDLCLIPEASVRYSGNHPFHFSIFGKWSWRFLQMKNKKWQARLFLTYNQGLHDIYRVTSILENDRTNTATRMDQVNRGSYLGLGVETAFLTD